jgi:Ca2+-binding RTX toxin-like protein
LKDVLVWRGARLVLNGGTGFNTLLGDEGNDALSLLTSDSGGSAYGESGNDLLVGSNVEFAFSWLEGNEGNDILTTARGGRRRMAFG